LQKISEDWKVAVPHIRRDSKRKLKKAEKDKQGHAGEGKKGEGRDPEAHRTNTSSHRRVWLVVKRKNVMEGLRKSCLLFCKGLFGNEGLFLFMG